MTHNDKDPQSHRIMRSKIPKNRQKTDDNAERFPLRHIYFYITNNCNLKCRHCWITPSNRDEARSRVALAGSLFRSILEQASSTGLVGVKLTGGEPLIHPEINDFLDYLISTQLPAGIETNGTNLTREIALKIARLRDAFVAVSLDGESAEIHEAVRGVPGCFEAAVNGIKNLSDAGLQPQIIMSLTQNNESRIVKVIRLAESLGAGSVKFNLVQPTGRGEDLHKNGDVIEVERAARLAQWVESELSGDTRLRLTFSIPIVFKPLSRIFCSAGSCDICRIQNILGVLPDGSFSLCGIGEHIPELILGHSAKDGLRDVWSQSPVLEEIRQGLPDRLKGICADCLMKKICRGNCIAVNYYRSRDLWAPFWFCEAAEKAGLFPVNRSISKLVAGK